MTNEDTLQIRVNGDAVAIERGATVAVLVAARGLRPEEVAVERNRDIVRRADHASTQLEDGDRIEIVTLVGGG